MSAEFKITLVRSHIGKPANQRAVLNGMGLNKMNKTVILKDTPEVRGMIRKVSHMLRVEE
jgi:large subunit ribosomal protein L30